jgi:hypothetical protein
MPAPASPHEPTAAETPDSPRFVSMCLMFLAIASLHGIARLAAALQPRRRPARPARAQED